MEVPAWAIIAVIGALGSAIGILFTWLMKSQSKVQEKGEEIIELHQELLNEKDEKIRILKTIRDKMSESHPGGSDGSDTES